MARDRPGRAHVGGRAVRDHSLGRLQRGDAAVAGGQPDRAGDVRADRHHADARRDRGPAPGTGAAGVPLQPPGIADNAVIGADARAAEAEIGHRSLAEDDRLRRLQPLGRRGVGDAGHALPVQPRAMMPAHPDRMHQVLDRDRHAVEGPGRRARAIAPPGGVRILQARVAAQVVEGVDGAVDPVGLGERHLHDLDRVEAAATIAGGQLGDGQSGKVVDIHGMAPEFSSCACAGRRGPPPAPARGR